MREDAAGTVDRGNPPHPRRGEAVRVRERHHASALEQNRGEALLGALRIQGADPSQPVVFSRAGENPALFYFCDKMLKMDKNLKLIIGLGNPEPEYQNTYHNVGALFAKYFKNLRDSQQWIPAKLLILVSEAYVNESGKFVIRELKNKNVKPENLLIAHDDSDLEIGKYKIDFGRGAAGHHGVESVQAALKTKDFWRLRIGIRPANEKVRQKAEKFVLKKISTEDKKILEDLFGKIAKQL